MKWHWNIQSTLAFASGLKVTTHAKRSRTSSYLIPPKLCTPSAPASPKPQSRRFSSPSPLCSSPAGHRQMTETLRPPHRVRATIASLQRPQRHRARAVKATIVSRLAKPEVQICVTGSASTQRQIPSTAARANGHVQTASFAQTAGVTSRAADPPQIFAAGAASI